MSAYLRGTGTAADPYVIHNAEALKEMLAVDFASGKYFEMVNDIDCAGAVFEYTSTSSIKSSANFTLNMNGFTANNFVMKNTSDGIYRSCNFNISFGVFHFTTAASYASASGSSFKLTDVSFSAGKFFSVGINSGKCIRCFFKVPFQNLSNASDCYSIGTAQGCTNTAGAPYDASSYPGLFANKEKWILDGVSYPTTIKRSRPDLTTGYAIKGVTRVGNSRKKRDITILSAAYRRPVWNGKSNDNGEFFAPLYDYYDAVIPLIFDDYGYPLKTDTAYIVGDVIHPASPNGYRYICEQEGSTGQELPAEPWSVEVLLTAGTAKFRPYPVYEPKCLGPIYPGKVNLVTGEKI